MDSLATNSGRCHRACLRAHRGQVDKNGKPYILHALRVMLRQEDETAQIVGVLHDVVEDTSVTLDDLRAAGFSRQVCEAVDCLTRRPDESYEAMISRVLANPLAKRSSSPTSKTTWTRDAASPAMASAAPAQVSGSAPAPAGVGGAGDSPAPAAP